MVISTAFNNPLGNKAFVEQLYELADDARVRSAMARSRLYEEITEHGRRTDPEEIKKVWGLVGAYTHRLTSLATLCDDTASTLTSLMVEFQELEKRQTQREQE